MKTRAKKTIKLLSLFTGCGGLDLGFEGGFEVLEKSINKKIHPEWNMPSERKGWTILPHTKFKSVFANDILPAAKAAWIPHFSKNGNKKQPFHLASIVDLVKASKSTKPNIFPNADIVIGGFPCQDFSVSGKRNGFNSHKDHQGSLLSKINNPTVENRGKLYIWMKHIIERVRPKAFVAENVKGLVSLANAKKIIENDFRNIGSGYLVVEAQVLYAPMYGIPQSRERVIFIGFRMDVLTKEAKKELASSHLNKKFNPYPTQTHGSHELPSLKDNSLLPYVNVGDYILDLPEPEDSNDLSQQAYSKARWYGSHCQGQTEVDLGGIGPTIRAEHHGNIEFRRLSPEHGGKYKKEINAGLHERRLTVRECARLQTFPDDFEFVRKPSAMGQEYKLSASEGYKLVGNAVPPFLGFHIAWRLQELWPILMK